MGCGGSTQSRVLELTAKRQQRRNATAHLTLFEDAKYFEEVETTAVKEVSYQPSDETEDAKYFEEVETTAVKEVSYQPFDETAVSPSEEECKEAVTGSGKRNPLQVECPPIPTPDEEMQEMFRNVEESIFASVQDITPSLPAEGKPVGELMALMEKRSALDSHTWSGGKASGAVYHGGREHMEMIGKVYSMFAFTNPLHPNLHPATRQMDAEVVQMVLGMYNGDEESCGAFTTGGTESILMAMKAYRDQARLRGITQPNIVVPATAHAAFEKACAYFDITLRSARTTHPDQVVEVAHVSSLMDDNTIALVGSAPQYPSGSVDPIEELGELALKRGCGLHVDCCLGGFLVPFMEKAGFDVPKFDFRVPGVTTISCDPHKYGFSPKGASVVMFRNKELRHHMYTLSTQWTGGIYATAGILGSRPGGPVAATWAAMVATGEKGYTASCRAIVGATRKMAEGVRSIPELELLGRPDVCVVAMACTKESGLNTYSLESAMRQERGWDLASLQKPAGIHLAVTLPSVPNADRFVDDLRYCVGLLKSDSSGRRFSSGSAALYGSAQEVPLAFMDQAAAVYLDIFMQTTPSRSPYSKSRSKRGSTSPSPDVERPAGRQKLPTEALDLFEGDGLVSAQPSDWESDAPLFRDASS
eukprot:Hpha_TRINITY_DN16620_c1_g12::TRINITY_DN16620_c1_g12_i1::g.179116::m.179116/K01634/SGPL1, DPL1; sphinganine-1-phosphate aldolase